MNPEIMSGIVDIGHNLAPIASEAYEKYKGFSEVLGGVLLAKSGVEIFKNRVIERIFGKEERPGLVNSLITMAGGVIQKAIMHDEVVNLPIETYDP